MNTIKTHTDTRTRSEDAALIARELKRISQPPREDSAARRDATVKEFTEVLSTISPDYLSGMMFTSRRKGQEVVLCEPVIMDINGEKVLSFSRIPRTGRRVTLKGGDEDAGAIMSEVASHVEARAIKAGEEESRMNRIHHTRAILDKAYERKVLESI